ncbi:FliI/YscN family ATPase [Aciditerrimonas ferrireducens]|jgi:flagellum-specific ATP synthase|uniref:FliI/YscN family ATPase n=1 Tax=Aciditerrimonas ferrireducens TaxID=667306 RepID=A0ABV6C0T5_9ACTN|nr:FliI/YscN family ATPase [Aciditerrimonas ferrireducens]MCK4177619.1 FliI/YscN family ATPase [Aciditerrimonas ferrireducens]
MSHRSQELRTVRPAVVARLRQALAPYRTGRVRRLVGLRVDVEGVDAAVGDALRIVRVGPEGTSTLPAEVVAVHGEALTCLPLGELAGVRFGDPVEALGGPLPIGVGSGLLGRVLDGLGRPIDDQGPLAIEEEVGINGDPPHPLRRDLVDRQLGLGVRVLDTLVPCGRGQRLGIFAGSGVGKSSLLSMIARGTEAEVAVVALVGERGREVNEFLQRDLGEDGLRRSVVVVATSDEPALVRIRAAFTATRIAEWFRDQGADVVLMMDSLTRFAMAQREVGLSAGEPPATRGYPPSVFSLLPRLLERAGAAERGSITGLYTVLVEGDDMNEPIADAARSILDGHVVLSRKLATAGHFPSVDVLESISRVEPAVTTPVQRAAARELRRLLAAERDVRDLVEIGAYVAGTNPLADRALAAREAIWAFLRQDVAEVVPTAQSWAQLDALVADSAQTTPAPAPAMAQGVGA